VILGFVICGIISRHSIGVIINRLF